MEHEYDPHTSMDRYAHLNLKMFYLSYVDSPPLGQLLEKPNVLTSTKVLGKTCTHLNSTTK